MLDLGLGFKAYHGNEPDEQMLVVELIVLD